MLRREPRASRHQAPHSSRQPQMRAALLVGRGAAAFGTVPPRLQARSGRGLAGGLVELCQRLLDRQSALGEGEPASPLGVSGTGDAMIAENETPPEWGAFRRFDVRIE